MAHRCFTLLGAPDLWTRLGWLQGSTQNGMKWGVLTLLETTHSRGCYLKFAVLLVQSVCSPRRPKTKDPRLCALGAYIAGDTLCHQPMGVGHVTVLQLHGPMGSVSCNGVTQCWPAQRGQAIVPRSSPYMVHEKWIQARARRAAVVVISPPQTVPSPLLK